MTETMKHPEMRNTVFGAVVVELLEARGLEVSPAAVGLLAEQAGGDGWRFINRMVDDRNEHPGDLSGLARKLDLSEPEMMELAHACTYEERVYHPSRTSGVS